jgi:uncharacterized protein
MASDDLDRPLGLEQKFKPRRGWPTGLLSLLAFGGLAGAFVFLQWQGDPFGGEPHAVAMLEKTAVPPQAKDPQPQTAMTEPDKTNAPAAPKGMETAENVESRSGVKVVRPSGANMPGALIIDVPRALGVRLVPAPDRRLVEKSRYGLIPRIGPDGARPADVYARPLVPAFGKINGPRIVLVVGGMGLSESSTATAIAALPPAVTLAFAPYGNDLEADAARAREAGHEIILQLPMEPVDYPRVNPGPHALVTAHGAAENIEDLHWLFSRFTGYVGVGNFLGGKFTADDSSMTPILQEIASRGLFYFDDSSAPRSVALARAADVNLNAVKADIVVDAVARPEAIDLALKKLEALAREKGLAIGAASGLPVSLDRLTRFSREAEAHGLVIVPLSAVRNIARVSEESRSQDVPH